MPLNREPSTGWEEGISWAKPMPTRSAPTAFAITMPSPVIVGALVEGMVSDRPGQ